MNVWHYETKAYDELVDRRALASFANWRRKTAITIVRFRAANERSWKVEDWHFDQAIWNSAPQRCRTRRTSPSRYNLTSSRAKTNPNLFGKRPISSRYRDSPETSSRANIILQIRLWRVRRQEERDFNRIQSSSDPHLAGSLGQFQRL